MMEIIQVHPRVHKRHPELYDHDVKVAWMNAIASTVRETTEPVQFVAVGFDNSGRLVEMVANRLASGTWTIFHAMTPPSEKTLRALQLKKE